MVDFLLQFVIDQWLIRIILVTVIFNSVFKIDVIQLSFYFGE
jgi:hypothetical protein